MKNTLTFAPFILNNTLSSWTPSFLKTFFVDHIVVIVFDPKNNTLEYYDSQKKTIEDEHRFLLGLNKTPKEVFGQFRFFEKQPPYWKNNTFERQQNDSIQCGAFLCRFIRERLKRSFDSVCSDTNIDINQQRRLMADELIGIRDT